MKEDWEAGRNTTSIGASLLTAQTAKGSKITDEDIKQTCIAMLQGSSETISGTLTW
jgi:cytochrome P450